MRDFLYERVYDIGRVHYDFIKARKVIQELYSVLMESPEQMKSETGLELGALPLDPQRASDFIAGMTDRYALISTRRFFFPNPGPCYNEVGSHGSGNYPDGLPRTDH